MQSISGWSFVKLILLSLLSSLWLGLSPQTAQAHEINPTIADFTVTDGKLTLDLRLNVEAFVARIDLDAHEDTSNSNEEARYSQLRSMMAPELAPLVAEFAAVWAQGIRVQADKPVELHFAGVDIPFDDDLDLPRTSVLTLTGAVGRDAKTLTLQWPEGAGYLVLRQQGVEAPYTGFLVGGEATPSIRLAGGGALTGWQAFFSYIPVGFDHILPKGLDHILFVLALFFLSAGLRPLILQISAFTLAHTVTLAFGALGWVQVPASVVEPLIAASIAFVALENLFTDRLNRWRPAVVFGFGLLHGLGFASVLMEFGLPQDQFLPSLIGFNVGVELGQLTVIAIAFLTVGLWFRNRPWYRSRIARPASVVIALIALYWTVERVFF